MESLKSGLETIRPGRTVFRRTVRFGKDTTSKAPLNLLWLHGSCASSAQYDALLEAMATTVPDSMLVECHLYDAFGCGESPLDKNAGHDSYSTAQQVLDLEAVYQSLDESVPTVLIGHSYAPVVITRFLDKCPCENVIGLIYMSSTLKDGPAPVADGGHPIFRLPVFVLKCMQNMLSKSFCDMAFHPNSDPQLREASLSSSNRNEMGMCKAYTRQIRFATSNEAKRAQRGRPALVIHGENDGIISMSGGQHLSDVLNAKFVVIKEASHQVMQEKPQEAAAAIWSFLVSLRQSR